MTVAEQLRQIHGDKICHICGCLCREQGLGYCSYPHERVPVAPADPTKPEGFWSWQKPKIEKNI